MRVKSKLNPKIALVYDTNNTYNIPIVIVDALGKILHIDNILKTNDYYTVRHTVINVIDSLVQKYNIDTIIFEQNKLFVDKIDKYPDHYILRDVMLGFGLQVTIEDKYHESLTLLSLPEYDWKNSVLGRKATYAIDLYKAHILHRTDIPIKFLVDIDTYNYYKAICLSESILFDKLMDKKYQINKGV